MDAAYIDTRGFDPVDTMLANTFLEAYKSPDDTVMEVSFYSCCLLRNEHYATFLTVIICVLHIHQFALQIFLFLSILGGGDASSQACAAAHAAQFGAAV